MPPLLDELIGPYERWACGAGAPYLAFDPEARDSPHVIALAELPAGLPPDGFVGGGAGLRVPTLWRPALEADGLVFFPLVITSPDRPPTRHGPDPIVRGLAFLAEASTRGGGGHGRIDYRVNGPLRPATVNEGYRPDVIDSRDEGQPPSSRASVIVAVIDDGLPFAHRNLRDASGATRVDYCWLQGADADDDRGRQSVLFGREYLAGDIDRMIAACVDEDRLYEEAAREPVSRGARRRGLATHGAHVLDSAAGHRHGAPPDPHRPTGPAGNLDGVRVIAVQLPAPVTMDTSGLGKDAAILSAFHYIFERADRIARRAGSDLPLVINFSYGFTGGPHGGRDRLERALRALVRQREARVAPTHLVMPAGNSFLSALHGDITGDRLRPGADGKPSAFAVPWRIQPCDRTPNYLEIWLPPGARPDGIGVTVRDPLDRVGHAAIVVQDPGPITHHDMTDGRSTIGQLSLERFAVGSESSLWRFVVAIAPTEPDHPSLPAAPPGLWTIELAHVAEVIASGPIVCRIQRDLDPLGYAYGARQSYFDDPLDERYDATGRAARGENPDAAFVRRLGTLNGLATHDAVTVVGGYVTGSGAPAAYASAGELSVGSGAGLVQMSAPSEASPALAGIRAAGARSGAAMRLSGTSAAAPQVARSLAVAYLEGVAPGAARDMLAHRLMSVSTGDGELDPVLRARLGEVLLVPASTEPDGS